LLQDARIIVLHAYEARDPGSVQRALIDDLYDPQSMERDEATRAMRDYVRASGITPSKTVVIPLATAPAETIRRIAEREQVDLIVIGTQGRSGLERFVLGSVAQDLAANSSVDVMVAPLPPA
jgi:nucleotide-binding universal stress UspA family protein